MLITVLTVVLGLCLLVVLAGAIIEGTQVREDLDPLPPSAGPRPEESERPFPGPVIDQPAVADRVQGRMAHGKSFATRRWEWAVAREVDELIREAEGRN
jgi:hypothetical protein